MAPSRASAAREGGGEASVGVRAGWAIEPRKDKSGCRRCHRKRKARSAAAFSRVVVGPRGVEEPVHGKRRTTGMRKGMREPYVEDLASHGGPESCVGVPRGRSEALTGVHAGRAIEPRNSLFGVPTRVMRRKATSPAALSRVAGGPRAVGEPVHACDLSCREPGDLAVARRCDDARPDGSGVDCGRRAARGRLRR